MLTLNVEEAHLRCVKLRYETVGKPCFVAGGFVRDILLGIQPRDIDIFVAPGEYAFAKVCAVWRKVCDGLLSEDTEYHSQSDFLPYPHPAEKKDITD